MAASEAMSCSSSTQSIVDQFLEVLKSLSPALRLVIITATPWVTLGLALAKYHAITGAISAVKNYITSWVTATVLIPSSHPLHKRVMTYMIDHGLGTNARKLALQTPQAQAARSNRNDYILDLMCRSKKQQKQEDPELKRTNLEYVPDVGQFVFTFRGQRMTFVKRAPTNADVFADACKIRFAEQPDSDTIIISCINLTGNAQPIKDFLTFIQDATDKATESMTKIFRAEYSAQVGSLSWDEGVARPARDLAAITLDSHIKDPLVQDVESYLSEETKKFYISRNIPWRRGFLFYGPPGTGKTSMAMAMAGQYGLNLYLLSMTQSGLNDQTLENLFEALPNRCIVLLEDIDSAGIKRENMRNTPAPPLKRKKKKKRKDSHDPFENSYEYFDGAGNLIDSPATVGNSVTLSTLLNILDGVHAPEGRIVIMTSNNPDSLDRALLRPGRIDRKVLFDYASREVCTKLYTRVFVESTHDEDVCSLAKQFAEKIPENAITPAEVQGHLLQNMGSGRVALENTDKFVADTLAEKQKGIFKAEAASHDDRNESDVDSSEESEDNEEVEFSLLPSPPAPPPPLPLLQPPPPPSHMMLSESTTPSPATRLQRGGCSMAGKRTLRSKNRIKNVVVQLLPSKKEARKSSGKRRSPSDKNEPSKNECGWPGAATAGPVESVKGAGTSESGTRSGTMSPARSVSEDETSRDFSTPPTSESEKDYERGSDEGDCESKHVDSFYEEVY